MPFLSDSKETPHMVRYEVLDSQGKRVALCNSKQLAESYQSTSPGSKIIQIRG